MIRLVLLALLLPLPALAEDICETGAMKQRAIANRLWRD